MLERSARWLARRDVLPTSICAVLGYYADSGVLDYNSLRLKQQADETVEELTTDAFRAVEEAIAGEFGYDYVEFEYDTKLLLPAKLTLGYLYRRLDESEHARAEGMTRLVVEALLDGDMRDALNDREFDDFEVDFPVDESDRARVAEISQEVLQARVKELLSGYPEAVEENYNWAVDISETHQDQDEAFRELMADARETDDALERIHSEYKDASFDDQPALFTEEELSIPYLKTQYDRVGIIYDAMIEMYRGAGLHIEDSFQRSIVLAIIGAQIWLDDIDDYEADMQDGQLTPVTAEYLLAASDREAHRRVVEIGRQYLTHAKSEAKAANSTLTGIAAEYILRDGTPETLPGNRGERDLD